MNIKERIRKMEKNEWMTEEILDLMKVRRQHKYKETHKGVRKKIREAKQLWIEEIYVEIEELQDLERVCIKSFERPTAPSINSNPKPIAYLSNL